MTFHSNEWRGSDWLAGALSGALVHLGEVSSRVLRVGWRAAGSQLQAARGGPGTQGRGHAEAGCGEGVLEALRWPIHYGTLPGAFVVSVRLDFIHFLFSSAFVLSLFSPFTAALFFSLSSIAPPAQTQARSSAAPAQGRRLPPRRGFHDFPHSPLRP